MFNNFDPDRLRDAIGADRCGFGMPFVMATLNREGKLSSTISQARKTLRGDQRWVELFRSAGITSAFEPDMLLWLRCHVPICIAMESISVMGQQRGGGASWSESMVVAHGVHGAFAVIKGLGYRLYPSAKSILNSFPAFLLASMLWLISRNTTFRELLATGANECRALVDVMVAASVEAKSIDPKAATAILAMKPSRHTQEP
jgi:2-dehydropantoate 2-reductase